MPVALEVLEQQLLILLHWLLHLAGGVMFLALDMVSVAELEGIEPAANTELLNKNERATAEAIVIPFFI